MTTNVGSVSERVGLLIQLRYGGSVNAAAREMGVPQRTLARLAGGETQSPNPDLLTLIARNCKVSESWLQSGQGIGPRQWRLFGAGKAESEWFRLVESLDLDERRMQLLLDIPDSAVVASHWLEPSAGAERRVSRPIDTAQFPHVAVLTEAIYRAWTEYLRVFLLVHGKARLANALSDPKAQAILALGASPALEQHVHGSRADPLTKKALAIFGRYLAGLRKLTSIMGKVDRERQRIAKQRHHRAAQLGKPKRGI